MKAFFPLVILSLVCLLTHAQDKSFDLSKYKLPDIKRHSLDFNIDASGNMSEYSTKYWPAYSSSPETKDISNSIFHSKSELSYNYYLNTHEKIVKLNSAITSRIDYEKNKGADATTSQYNPDIWGYFHEDISLYPYENNFFWKIEPSVSLGYLRNKGKKDGKIFEKATSNSFSIKSGLGFGKGRIEPISDLWQSYYILKKLKEQSLLKRDLKEEDVLRLANLASSLKNKRFFDFRLRKIAEMKSIDSLMHEEGLAQETNVAYFSTINDYWNFASIHERYSGNEIKFLLRPEYDGSWYKNSNQEDYDTHRTSITPELAYENNKVINLFFDRAFWCKNSYHFLLNQKNDDYSNLLVDLSAGYRLSYYPNFRTTVSGSISYYGNEFFNVAQNHINKKWSNELHLYFFTSYYISPQLRISGHARFQYKDKQEGALRDIIVTNYQLSFSYAIF